MKKLLLNLTQLVAGGSFVFINAQTDPVGAAVVAIVTATVINLLLGVVLTAPKLNATVVAGIAGAFESNGKFDLKKLGAFLEHDYAVTRVGVLALALIGASVSTGMTQQGLTALFIAGAATQVAAIASDNSAKLQAVLAAISPKASAPISTP